MTDGARYWVVEWSGGGGFGHSAWLLSDALTECCSEVVLATRRTPELAALPHRHAVAGLWPDAPATQTRLLRRPIVFCGRTIGWIRLVRRVAQRRGRGDIVHLQAADRLAELPFLLALRATGVTIVATAHNALPHDSGRVARAAARLLYRIPHGIVTHTEPAADQIRRSTRGRRRVLVVPHPSYLPMVDHFATSATTKADSRVTVASIGLIRPYKGFERIAATVATAIVRFPDLRFVVAGRAVDARGLDIALAGLPSDNVERDPGHLPIARLIDHARSADVVLLAHRSTSESGIAHLALAAGAVVVAPRAAALERLLGSEPTWLYDAGDPSDATRALLAALETVQGDRAAMRRRARALAEAVPSWATVSRAMKEFAESLRVTQ